MVGLSIPDDFPLLQLIGQELIQVCIGSHHVRLNFSKPQMVIAGVQKWEDGAAIDLEAGFALREKTRSAIFATNDILGHQAGSLTALLGQRIAAVKKLDNNELLLLFSNGSELQLVTDPEGFESYHLHIEGDTVDVTKP